MRTLTTVQSASLVQMGISVAIKAADASTTWVWSDAAIVQAPTWELPFGGGMGKPVNYQVQLASSDGFWRTERRKLANGEVRLTISANSDTWQPHLGLVRGITPSGDVPALAVLDVFDKGHAADPLVPGELLTDSYTPAVPDLGLGYPLYYGYHHRPFLFCAVASDIGTLLAPRNISSANHVNSVFWTIDPQTVATSGAGPLTLYDAAWLQQSGSTNLATNSKSGFVVQDIQGYAPKLFGAAEVRFDSPIGWKPSRFGLDGAVVSIDQRSGSIGIVGRTNDPGVTDSGDRFSISIRGDSGIGATQTTSLWQCTVAWSYSLVTPLGNASFGSVLLMGAGSPYVVYQNSSGNAFADFSSQWVVNGNDIAMWWEGNSPAIQLNFEVDGSLTYAGVNQLEWWGTYVLRPDLYKQYSAFALPVDSSEVAISANPVGILDDLTSHHLSIPYLQDQSSATQAILASSGYQFQCFLAERRPFSAIADEFGQLAGFYGWYGDSGCLHYLAYAESATAQGSVAMTITRDQMIGTPMLELQPIGFGGRTIQQAAKVKLGYAYDFQLGQCVSTVQRDRNDNALCTSADAAGLTTEVDLQTQYVTDPDVASACANNLVRRVAQEFMALSFKVRNGHELEPGDIVQVGDPLLPNSSELMQIFRLTPDWQGTEPGMEVVAARIQNADGS